MQTESSHLPKMFDAEEQYSERPCLVINGMAKSGPEGDAYHSDDVNEVIETLERECGISQDFIKKNLNKTHPVGWPDTYGKEIRIVKFTTVSFKEIAEIQTFKGKNVVVELVQVVRNLKEIRIGLSNGLSLSIFRIDREEKER